MNITLSYLYRGSEDRQMYEWETFPKQLGELKASFQTGQLEAGMLILWEIKNKAIKPEQALELVRLGKTLTGEGNRAAPLIEAVGWRLCGWYSDQVLNLARSAADVLTSAKYREAQAFALDELGQILYKQAYVEDARDCFRKACFYTNHQDLKTLSQLRLAQTWLQDKNGKFEHHMELAEHAGDAKMHWLWSYNNAQFYRLHQFDPDKATIHLEQALRLSSRDEHIPTMISSLIALVLFYWQDDYSTVSLDWCLLAMELGSLLRSPIYLMNLCALLNEILSPDQIPGGEAVFQYALSLVVNAARGITPPTEDPQLIEVINFLRNPFQEQAYQAGLIESLIRLIYIHQGDTRVANFYHAAVSEYIAQTGYVEYLYSANQAFETANRKG